MSDMQKKLKLFSFGIMGFGILDVIGGVLMLMASPMAAAMRFTIGSDVVSGNIAAEVIGVVALVVGVYCLVVGVLGARAANNPRRIGAFRVLDVVLIVASLVEFGLGISTGQFSWVELALAVLGICALVFAGRAHNEALDR